MRSGINYDWYHPFRGMCVLPSKEILEQVQRVVDVWLTAEFGIGTELRGDITPLRVTNGRVKKTDSNPFKCWGYRKEVSNSYFNFRMDLNQWSKAGPIELQVSANSRYTTSMEDPSQCHKDLQWPINFIDDRELKGFEFILGDVAQFKRTEMGIGKRHNIQLRKYASLNVTEMIKGMKLNLPNHDPAMLVFWALLRNIDSATLISHLDFTLDEVAEMCGNESAVLEYRSTEDTECPGILRKLTVMQRVPKPWRRMISTPCPWRNTMVPNFSSVYQPTEVQALIEGQALLNRDICQRCEHELKCHARNYEPRHLPYYAEILASPPVLANELGGMMSTT